MLDGDATQPAAPEVNFPDERAAAVVGHHERRTIALRTAAQLLTGAQRAPHVPLVVVERA